MNIESAIAHVLVVEDDPSIMAVIQGLLEEAGYFVSTANDGQVGLSKALSATCDLVILDLNLPKISGLDVCRQVKVDKPNLPVLMLTARAEDSDIVAGLEIGADDYLTKPFSPRELLARVRARLRPQSRANLSTVSETTEVEPKQSVEAIYEHVLRFDDLEIDGPRMIVRRAGKEISLTSREFEVVYLLASNPGRVISRENLLQEAWGIVTDGYRINVSIMMSRIRKKIEDDQDNPQFILTVRGVGYKFREN
jgi:two-component system alkaline phosphatase synthesis response regulator PhoP